MANMHTLFHSQIKAIRQCVKMTAREMIYVRKLMILFCLIVSLNSSKSDDAFIHEANQPEETHFKSKTG